MKKYVVDLLQDLVPSAFIEVEYNYDLHLGLVHFLYLQRREGWSVSNNLFSLIIILILCVSEIFVCTLLGFFPVEPLCLYFIITLIGPPFSFFTFGSLMPHFLFYF